MFLELRYFRWWWQFAELLGPFIFVDYLGLLLRRESSLTWPDYPGSEERNRDTGRKRSQHSAPQGQTSDGSRPLSPTPLSIVRMLVFSPVSVFGVGKLHWGAWPSCWGSDSDNSSSLVDFEGSGLLGGGGGGNC